MNILKNIFVCEVSIIVFLICQKLESAGPLQQKIKLPLPNNEIMLQFKNF